MNIIFLNMIDNQIKFFIKNISKKNFFHLHFLRKKLLNFL